jgi:hypothetical protein
VCTSVACFLQYGDLQLRTFRSTALFLQLRNPQRRGESRRAAPDNQDVDVERFACQRLTLLELRHDGWRELEEIPHDPVIRHLEDRRIRILVDGNDDAAALHADQMLNRT